MKKGDIKNKLKGLVEKILDESITDAGFIDETTFHNDLDVDSLDYIELIMECEKEFLISLDDNRMENIETVGEFVDYLQEIIT